MSLKRDLSPAAFWWACAIAAPPIAFAVAAAGFAMATTDPLRDIAVIGLVSVAEEIVFRGALQPALDRAFAGRLPSRWQASFLTPANLATPASADASAFSSPDNEAAAPLSRLRVTASRVRIKAR